MHPSAPFPGLRSDANTRPQESAVDAKEAESGQESQVVDEKSPQTVLPRQSFARTAEGQAEERLMGSTTTGGRQAPAACKPSLPAAAQGSASSSSQSSNIETSDHENFATAESGMTGSAKNASMSEHSSAFLTATDMSGVQSPPFQVVRSAPVISRLRRPPNTPLPADTTQVALINEAGPAGTANVNIAVEPSPTSPQGVTSPEQNKHAVLYRPNIDTIAEVTQCTTQSLMELVNQPMTMDVGALPSRSEEACSQEYRSSQAPQKYRTPSIYRDWPKHETEVIPDTANIILTKAETEEEKDIASPKSEDGKNSSILEAAGRLLGLMPNEQPAQYQPISESHVQESPAGIDSSTVIQKTATKDDTGPRKVVHIRRSSSTNLTAEAVEVATYRYKPESMLNFEADQIEDPAPLSRPKMQPLPLVSTPAKQGDMISSSPAGDSPLPSSNESKNDASGSMIMLIADSVSALLTDVIVAATSRRYWILIMFCALSMINAFQWIQYTIITSIIEGHFGVNENAVSWTSMLYLAGYLTMALPSAWIIDNLGLRHTLLIGAAGTAIGAGIKTFAVDPGQFNLVLLGQAFPALSQAFILGVPPRLTSAWFRYQEISTASSICALGNNMGIALGFVIPPNVVEAHNVSTSLTYLCVVVAIFSCLCLLALLVAFQEKPKYPPSFSEMMHRSASKKMTFAEELGTLLMDRNFWLLLGSYGLNTGAFYTICTLLNPVNLTYFPGEERFAGWLGLAIIVAGLVGSWLFGVVVEKTGKYKQVTLIVYLISAVSVFAYTFLLSARSHLLSVLACSFLGFFMAGYIPIGLQLAAEITYPMPPGMSCNMMSMSAQVIGIVMILLSQYVRDAYGNVTSNLCLATSLLFGCAMSFCIRGRLKRQEEDRRGSLKGFSPPSDTERSHEE